MNIFYCLKSYFFLDNLKLKIKCTQFTTDDTMRVLSLYYQCKMTLLQNLSADANPSALLSQLRQPGLVQVFTNRLLTTLVDWCPMSMTDGLLDTISNKNLTSFTFKCCARISIDSVVVFLERYFLKSLIDWHIILLMKNFALFYYNSFFFLVVNSYIRIMIVFFLQ